MSTKARIFVNKLPGIPTWRDVCGNCFNKIEANDFYVTCSDHVRGDKKNVSVHLSCYYKPAEKSQSEFSKHFNCKYLNMDFDLHEDSSKTSMKSTMQYPSTCAVPDCPTKKIKPGEEIMSSPKALRDHSKTNWAHARCAREYTRKHHLLVVNETFERKMRIQSMALKPTPTIFQTPPSKRLRNDISSPRECMTDEENSQSQSSDASSSSHSSTDLKSEGFSFYSPASRSIV